MPLLNKKQIKIIEDITQHLEETIIWYRNHATLDQKYRVIRSFIDQDNMDEFKSVLAKIVFESNNYDQTHDIISLLSYNI